MAGSVLLEGCPFGFIWMGQGHGDAPSTKGGGELRAGFDDLCVGRV